MTKDEKIASYNDLLLVISELEKRLTEENYRAILLKLENKDWADFLKRLDTLLDIRTKIILAREAV